MAAPAPCSAGCPHRPCQRAIHASAQSAAAAVMRDGVALGHILPFLGDAGSAASLRLVSRAWRKEFDACGSWTVAVSRRVSSWPTLAAADISGRAVQQLSVFGSNLKPEDLCTLRDSAAFAGTLRALHVALCFGMAPSSSAPWGLLPPAPASPLLAACQFERLQVLALNDCWKVFVPHDFSAPHIRWLSLTNSSLMFAAEPATEHAVGGLAAAPSAGSLTDAAAENVLKLLRCFPAAEAVFLGGTLLQTQATPHALLIGRSTGDAPIELGGAAGGACRRQSPRLAPPAAGSALKLLELSFWEEPVVRSVQAALGDAAAAARQDDGPIADGLAASSLATATISAAEVASADRHRPPRIISFLDAADVADLVVALADSPHDPLGNMQALSADRSVSAAAKGLRAGAQAEEFRLTSEAATAPACGSHTHSASQRQARVMCTPPPVGYRTLIAASTSCYRSKPFNGRAANSTPLHIAATAAYFSQRQQTASRISAAAAAAASVSAASSLTGAAAGSTHPCAAGAGSDSGDACTDAAACSTTGGADRTVRTPRDVASGSTAPRPFADAVAQAEGLPASDASSEAEATTSTTHGPSGGSPAPFAVATDEARLLASVAAAVAKARVRSQRAAAESTSSAAFQARAEALASHLSGGGAGAAPARVASVVPHAGEGAAGGTAGGAAASAAPGSTGTTGDGASAVVSAGVGGALELRSPASEGAVRPHRPAVLTSGPASVLAEEAPSTSTASCSAAAACAAAAAPATAAAAAPTAPPQPHADNAQHLSDLLRLLHGCCSNAAVSQLLDRKDASGNTALMRACEIGDARAIAVLLGHPLSPLAASGTIRAGAADGGKAAACAGAGAASAGSERPAIARLPSAAGCSWVPAKANARNHRQESPVYIAALRGHAAALRTLLLSVLQPEAAQAAASPSRGDGESTDVESEAPDADVAGAAVAPVIPASVSCASDRRPTGCGAHDTTPAQHRALHPSELLLQPAFLGPDSWTVLHAAVTSAKPDVIDLALAAALGLLHGSVNPPVGGGDSDAAAQPEAASADAELVLSQAEYTPEGVEAAVARAVEAIGDARASASGRTGASNSVLAFFEARDRHGCSALHYAARNGSADTVRLLLRCGCKRDVKNSLGQTPLAMLRGLQKRPTFRRVPAHDEIDAMLGGGR